MKEDMEETNITKINLCKPSTKKNLTAIGVRNEKKEKAIKGTITFVR